MFISTDTDILHNRKQEKKTFCNEKWNSKRNKSKKPVGELEIRNDKKRRKKNLMLCFSDLFE